MSQVHKTPYFVQEAIRTFIDANKTMKCQVVSGMAFEALEIPSIAVIVTSQGAMTSGNGATGNKTPSVMVMLQTGFDKSELEHWDMWAEVEDLFNYTRQEVLTALNECSQYIIFQNLEIRDLVNMVEDDVRKTILELGFLTSLKEV